jgi:hypothetical protein
MKKYSGIDLHSNNNVVVVIDDADRVVYRRRLPAPPSLRSYPMPTYSFKVNGKAVNVDAPAGMALLWVLRDKLGITGPKDGCGMNICKACTCLVNGKAVTTCSTTVSSVQGQECHDHRRARQRRHPAPSAAGLAGPLRHLRPDPGRDQGGSCEDAVAGPRARALE